MDVLVGTDASFRVEFTGPVGTLPADAGSVKWSLFDNSGAAFGEATTLANPEGATSVSIEVDAEQHTIDSARRFEARTLITRWKSNGQSYADRLSYRVIPMLNHAVTPDDVRAVLGLNEDELQDNEIDITAAYFSFEDSAGQTALADALASGAHITTHANRGIIAEAALAVFPSLRIRVGQTQTNGELRYERFRTTPEFDKIERMLRDMRSEALDLISDGVVVNPSMLVLTSPADVITGG